ncbi:MAG TPA: metalloregulator ArsR/SmtB family transcription factor [Candidatus Acidoferrum sp.]|jgi:ArsR family transcriptional regulator
MDRKKVEKISKALGDETRLVIFEAISSCDEMNCGEIIALQGVTPATVSHHLKILAAAELIESRREGQFVYNKAIPGTIEKYMHAISALTRRKKK